MEDKNHTVYIHIFPNGKVYVGITCLNVEHRWNGGKGYLKQRLIGNAVRKYGWDNVSHLVLHENLTKTEADLIEIMYISTFKSNIRKYGYNIESGGNSLGKHSEESRALMSKRQKGRTVTDETRKRMSKASKGRKMPDSAKKKLSEIAKQRGGRPQDPKYKKRIYQYSLETGEFIEEFESIRAASLKTKLKGAHISEAANERRRQAGGFFWIFKDDASTEEVMRRLEKCRRNSLYKPLYLVNATDDSIAAEFENKAQSMRYFGMYHDKIHEFIDKDVPIVGSLYLKTQQKR